MTGIVSLKAQRTTQEITAKPITNININNNLDSAALADSSTPGVRTSAIKKSGVKTRNLETNDVSVIYPESTDTTCDDVVVVKSSADYKKLENEVKFLKIIIDMMNNNPLMYNGCLLVDDEKLIELLLLQTQADEIQLDADDIMDGCFTGRTYRKVHAIYIVKDGETKQLKYDYPEICQELNELKIMWKYVW